MYFREFQRGNYTIYTDPAKLNVEKVHRFLSEYTYWAKNRTLETVRKSMENSLCFGIFFQDNQIGFARVVTDSATFAWLCDVIIVPEHRGAGLGKWMVECIVNHPDLVGIRRIVLATNDAHSLYEKYGGFKQLADPERWMEKFNPDAR
jgi:hypothetical protein